MNLGDLDLSSLSLDDLPKYVQKVMDMLIKAFQTIVNLYISTFVKDAATVDVGE